MNMGELMSKKKVEVKSKDLIFMNKQCMGLYNEYER